MVLIWRMARQAGAVLKTLGVGDCVILSELFAERKPWNDCNRHRNSPEPGQTERTL